MPTESPGLITRLPFKLRAKLEQCDDLPSLPMVAIKVLEICQDSNTDTRTLAKVIEQDGPLVARLLKVVNSPLFGLSRKIASVNQAVNLLGLHKTKIVVLGFSVMGASKKARIGKFDVKRYWARGISTAIAAKLLAARTGENPEEAFVAGLLQDIGVLALWHAAPEVYGEILQEYQETEDETLPEVEQRKLGAEHAAVSAWLLERWQLPGDFVQAIGYHNRTTADRASTTMQGTKRLAAILTLADHISALLWRNELQKHDSWESCPDLGLSSAEHEAVVLEVLQQYGEVSEAFDLDTFPEISEKELQDAARAELSVLALETAIEVDVQERRQSELQRTNQELAAAFERWQKVAKSDPLTGLANRAAMDAYLEEVLGQEDATHENLGIIMVDLDYFKEVNDNYGHIVGDHALCAVADTLQDCTRDHDLVARYGGDEFLIVLPNIDLATVQKIAERIHATVGAKIIDGAKERFSQSVSVGVACGEQLGDDFSFKALVDCADRSLYEAKEAGRNRVGKPMVLCPESSAS